MHDPVSDPASDEGPLGRERAHLAASRAALRAMRADAEALDISDVTANWVNATALRHQIELRIAALADLAHTPLFFGRLDYDETAGENAGRFENRRRPLPQPPRRPLGGDVGGPGAQRLGPA
ncbi:AAA family ATPase, partial [Streptomyces sp. NPDC059506]